MWQLVLLVLAALSAADAWNVDGGLVAPLGAGVRTVSVTSNFNETIMARILDGNDSSQWQSDA